MAMPTLVPASMSSSSPPAATWTNARKHATSAPVELRLNGAAGHGLTIEVRNPLPALAAAEPKIPGTGAGLLGLTERATLSGGRLEHGLDKHGHFRLDAWLPWPK
jgi:signal transduction histidine kinase